MRFEFNIGVLFESKHIHEWPMFKARSGDRLPTWYTYISATYLDLIATHFKTAVAMPYPCEQYIYTGCGAVSETSLPPAWSGMCLHIRQFMARDRPVSTSVRTIMAVVQMSASHSSSPDALVRKDLCVAETARGDVYAE